VGVKGHRKYLCSSCESLAPELRPIITDCRECSNVKKRLYYRNNKEKQREYSRRFRLNNPEYYKLLKARWNLNNPEKLKSAQAKYWDSKSCGDFAEANRALIELTRLIRNEENRLNKKRTPWNKGARKYACENCLKLEPKERPLAKKCPNCVRVKWFQYSRSLSAEMRQKFLERWRVSDRKFRARTKHLLPVRNKRRRTNELKKKYGEFAEAVRVQKLVEKVITKNSLGKLTKGGRNV
jgi:hypothetical protein